MKRLTVAAALLAVAVAAFATSSAQAKPKAGYHVFGDPSTTIPVGASDFAVLHDNFDVVGDASTFAATGFYERRTVRPSTGQDVMFRADIDCLIVTTTGTAELRVAYMFGTITESTDATAPIGTHVATHVVDAHSSSIQDTIGPFIIGLPPCAVSPALTFDFSITSGDVVVENCDHITGSGKCKNHPE